MSKEIVIEAGEVTLEGELYDTPSAEKVWESLPLEGSANTWGDEIYFSIGMELELEPDATDTMEVGSLAYWPVGEAFCVVFGPTPASGSDGTPRLASACNRLGRTKGDARRLTAVNSGDPIRVKAKE